MGPPESRGRTAAWIAVAVGLAVAIAVATVVGESHRRVALPKLLLLAAGPLTHPCATPNWHRHPAEQAAARGRCAAPAAAAAAHAAAGRQGHGLEPRRPSRSAQPFFVMLLHTGRLSQLAGACCGRLPPTHVNPAAGPGHPSPAQRAVSRRPQGSATTSESMARSATALRTTQRRCRCTGDGCALAAARCPLPMCSAGRPCMLLMLPRLPRPTRAGGGGGGQCRPRWGSGPPAGRQLCAEAAAGDQAVGRHHARRWGEQASGGAGRRWVPAPKHPTRTFLRPCLSLPAPLAPPTTRRRAPPPSTSRSHWPTSTQAPGASTPAVSGCPLPGGAAACLPTACHVACCCGAGF